MVCLKSVCYWCLHLRKFLFGNQPCVIVCCVIVGGDGDVKAVDVVVNAVDEKKEILPAKCTCCSNRSLLIKLEDKKQIFEIPENCFFICSLLIFHF